MCALTCTLKMNPRIVDQQSFEEAGVDGALIVQPINHKFDHSYVSSVINVRSG